MANGEHQRVDGNSSDQSSAGDYSQSDTEFDSNDNSKLHSRGEASNRGVSKKLQMMREHRNNARQIFEGLSRQAVTAIDFLIAPSINQHSSPIHDRK